MATHLCFHCGERHEPGPCALDIPSITIEKLRSEAAIARSKGAAAERAAIVQWLRTLDSSWDRPEYIADAIESAQHHPAKEGGEA